jgi:uncharacterized protein
MKQINKNKTCGNHVLMFIIILTLVLTLNNITDSRAGDSVPPPKKNIFITDHANLIKPEHREIITRIQDECMEKHKTPIIMATVESMAKYSRNYSTIEEFSKVWLDWWRKGPVNSESGDKAILFVVSQDDRKTRIELGPDWGHRWDNHCKRIMKNRIIPNFKKDKYSEGILIGIKKLEEMAKLSSEGKIPAPDFKDRFSGIFKGEKFAPSSLVPKKYGIYILVPGIMLLLAGLLFGRKGRVSEAIGIALISLCILPWYISILITLLMFLYPLNSDNGPGSGGFYRRSSYYGGGFSSGGGGGFFGGGGASGSW